ncbi:MAG: hypothetical protein CR976_02610 [Thiotrichales bacterium]|nr:MAG: hypothetical protein CR976_02610 [Thiotrichales bacterium]
MLIAITSAIFLSYEQLPNINRTISITPLDKKPVVLNYLRKVSIPDWMNIKLDGNVNQHRWLTDSDGAFYGNNQNGTLTTTIATFGQGIETSYKTGPEYGRARVKIDNQEMIINLSQPLAKEELAYLWPSPDMLIFKHYSAWKWPVKLLIYFSIIFLCLLWFTRKRAVTTLGYTKL